MISRKNRRSFLKAAGGLALTIPPVSQLPVAFAEELKSRLKITDVRIVSSQDDKRSWER